jgi:hypothetical protein
VSGAQWKQRERGTAAQLGTIRLPSNGKAQPDMIATMAGYTLAIEHKSLKGTLPLWLSRALDQAARNAPTETLPVVVVAASTGPGKPIRRVAMIDLRQLPALLRAATVAAEGHTGE